jgi:hypothetical protein
MARDYGAGAGGMQRFREHAAQQPGDAVRPQWNTGDPPRHARDLD